MDINYVKEGEITVITIKGRLDAATAPVADKIIKTILEGGCLRMLFDFSKLDYLSSGGLKVILGATKELRRKGGQIVLCSLPNLVREIFEVSCFNSMVPISESVDSVIEQLGVKPVQKSMSSGSQGLAPSPSGFDPTKRVQPLTA